jgi:hypothetical protein
LEGPAPSTVGATYARTRDIAVLACFLLLMTVILGTVLIQVWPPSTAVAAAQTDHASRVRILLWSPSLLRESRLFIAVAATGALGALIHTLRSLYWYVGNRALRRSWLLMYLTEPVVGAALALLVYFVLRGGLTTTMASPADINPYGVTAMAGLVGMFSRETAEKLRAVFETLLAPAKPGDDTVHPTEPRTDPPPGPTTDD